MKNSKMIDIYVVIVILVWLFIISINIVGLNCNKDSIETFLRFTKEHEHIGLELDMYDNADSIRTNYKIINTLLDYYGLEYVEETINLIKEKRGDENE